MWVSTYRHRRQLRGGALLPAVATVAARSPAPQSPGLGMTLGESASSSVDPFTREGVKGGRLHRGTCPRRVSPPSLPLLRSSVNSGARRRATPGGQRGTRHTARGMFSVIRPSCGGSAYHSWATRPLSMFPMMRTIRPAARPTASPVRHTPTERLLRATRFAASAAHRGAGWRRRGVSRGAQH